LITVVGSSNTDFSIRIKRIPFKGETILGDKFVIACGGKGANQAVAIARLGGEVTFIGKIGTDSFGDRTVDELKKSGVYTEYLLRDKLHHSGIALILVDRKGENVIAVFPGSNRFLKAGDILAAQEVIVKSKALVLQLEIPLEAIAKAIELAYKSRVKVILNAAPARELPEELLSKVDILILNERELRVLAGKEVKDLNTAYEAANKLLDKRTAAVVVTLSDRGAALLTRQKRKLIPAVQVKVVDTTAAGDAFTAALAIAVVEGKDLVESISFANRVAALTTTKIGAVDSLPTREEVKKFFVRN
jgi:ribokinase